MASGQKYGRNKKRSGSMAKYNGEMRWEKNKALRIARHKKAVEKKKLQYASPLAPTRGATRTARRRGLRPI